MRMHAASEQFDHAEVNLAHRRLRYVLFVALRMYLLHWLTGKGMQVINKKICSAPFATPGLLSRLSIVSLGDHPHIHGSVNAIKIFR